MERLGRQLYLTFKSSREFLDAHMATVDSSTHQWVILRLIGEEPGWSQRQLAERMELTGSTMTHHLDRLEAEGWISRTRDAADRRVVRVELTSEGKQRNAQLHEVAEAADRELRRLVSEREAAALNRLLTLLHRRLVEHP
jgi:MarR family transcriptional regulator for hemolysin